MALHLMTLQLTVWKRCGQVHQHFGVVTVRQSEFISQNDTTCLRNGKLLNERKRTVNVERHYKFVFFSLSSCGLTEFTYLPGEKAVRGFRCYPTVHPYIKLSYGG